MRITILSILTILSVGLFAQPTGYYNGTEGKTGQELKTALHEIINDHVAYSYFASKTIMKFSDVDPNNPENVILVYTGRSQANNDYGTGGNQINREHVWAKSHGNFEDVAPMYGDVHNLKPCDASVNQDKSNKDFDNGGTQHPEATGCYYTDDTWEPRDEVKGDIARIIFYMDARYEGTNGEMDLEVVDEINTYPLPEHGKLSTLLEWNMQDPPDDFERNRNNVIFSWQKNRNPFIDNPEFANLIWGDQVLPTISFGNFETLPAAPQQNEAVTVQANISTTSGSLSDVMLYWGTDIENLNSSISMTNQGGDTYACEVPGQSGATTVFYRVEATDGSGSEMSVIYSYYVAPIFNGTLTTIYDIQGQTEVSPLEGEVLSTTGIVTANFGENYFIQDGAGEWNGMFIYDPGRNPQIGDEVIVTGLVEEYYDKTEIKEIEGYYLISSNNELPQPVLINTGDGGEAYESVLVRVQNAICTDDEYQANFYMWKVNDGSGDMLVHNTSIFEYEPVLGETYDVTGPLNYDFDEWKIEIRLESDVTSGTDIFPPEVNEVVSLDDNLIRITFSEDVNPETATNIANYTLDNGVNITAAEMHNFLGNIAFLDVSKMETATYTLIINGVEDLVGNAMENVETEFYHESTGIDKLHGIESMSIYPNPAKEVIKLNLDATHHSEVIISVMEISGKTLLEQKAGVRSGNNIIEISAGQLSTGLYLLKVENNGTLGHLKLMVK